MPNPIPEMTAEITDSDSSVPAAVVDNPCAVVRYGIPHSSANTVIEN